MKNNSNEQLPVENICFRCVVFIGRTEFDDLCESCYNYEMSLESENKENENAQRSEINLTPFWTESSVLKENDQNSLNMSKKVL